MLDLLTFFLCEACGCAYNDLVICKDSSDCLDGRKCSHSLANYN